jgi:hypothetical protein
MESATNVKEKEMTDTVSAMWHACVAKALEIAVGVMEPECRLMDITAICAVTTMMLPRKDTTE